VNWRKEDDKLLLTGGVDKRLCVLIIVSCDYVENELWENAQMDYGNINADTSLICDVRMKSMHIMMIDCYKEE
jgi:hypothetical protein